MHAFIRLTKIALIGLRTNRVRTLLTTSGIVIGIATVMIVISLGESAKNAVAKQLLSFGGNTIFIEISVPNSSHSQDARNFISGVQVTSMKEADLESLISISNIDKGYAMVLSKEKVRYLNRSSRVLIHGTNSAYPLVDTIKVAKGRFFTISEEKNQSKVTVLGPELAKELFQEIDPIGQSIKINQISFKVIGIMEPRGNTFIMNMDDTAFIPLKIAQKMLLGIDYITFMSVSVFDRDRIEKTAEDIRLLLRKRHNIPFSNPKKDDFNVTTTDDALAITDSVLGGVSILLSVIATISLIVGGIGIMNIMYVSVSERTKEIGLRKAIGAKNSDILLQFLLEALGITGLGGGLGVLFGILIITLASLGARYFQFDWEFIVSIKSILVAFSASTAVGLIFGINPARKASNLDPIVALRRE